MQNHDFAVAQAAGAPAAQNSTFKLAFASLGIVFGDIGTSPLYALREALSHISAGHQAQQGEVVGIVSLLLWTLIIIVTLKYVMLLMRADNRGEGGLLSLVALVSSSLPARRHAILLLGLVGAAFFFGDVMITPAISVLSAVEGLAIIHPGFADLVVPLTIGILTALFLVQSRGTAGLAAMFAPVTATWFIVLAALGLGQVWHNPEILLAINPAYGLGSLIANPDVALLALGGVFLAVTGAEALYADMGHFGRRPIRLAWTSLVFPALALNYLGQGALILSDPQTLINPFYLLAPAWALAPLVALATAVTVIASQAVITAAFSVTRQAILLGLLPRMSIAHTSELTLGQIYIPQINWLVFLGVVLLVAIFRSSSALASAYGIAVNASLLVDTSLAFLFFWKARHWPLWRVGVVVGAFAVVEAAFFAANGLKLLSGGYVPILIAAAAIMVMATWLRGRQSVARKLQRESVELNGLLDSLSRRMPQRVPGIAVFLLTDPVYAPSALMHNLKHNHVLHECLVFLHIETADEPRVSADDRVKVSRLPLNSWLVDARAGYMEEPDVPMILRSCRSQGLDVDPAQASYFLGRRLIRVARHSPMPRWQQQLFVTLADHAQRTATFYRIPANRVIELGVQISV